MRAAPKVRAADALSEQGIAGKQDVAVAGKQEAGAAGRVAGRMNRADLDSFARNTRAIIEKMIDDAAFRHGNADELRLHVELLEEEQIGFVNRRRRFHAFL